MGGLITLNVWLSSETQIVNPSVRMGCFPPISSLPQMDVDRDGRRVLTRKVGRDSRKGIASLAAADATAFPKPVPNCTFPKWAVGDGEMGMSRGRSNGRFRDGAPIDRTTEIGRLRSVCFRASKQPVSFADNGHVHSG